MVELAGREAVSIAVQVPQGRSRLTIWVEPPPEGGGVGVELSSPRAVPASGPPVLRAVPCRAVNLERAVALLIGDHGRVRDVAFREGGVELRCRVPEDNLWGAVKDVLVLGEYERSGIRLEEATGVVVDAGAHVGLFSLLASTRARSVLAFEARPENVALLEENVARNGRSNIAARHAAVWTVDGTTSFAEGDQTSSGSVLAEDERRSTHRPCGQARLDSRFHRPDRPPEARRRGSGVRHPRNDLR